MFWDKVAGLYDTYQEFYRSAEYTDVEYRLVQGRMPCAIAVITKR